MIVTDLDGTFYDSEHNFHNKNIEAVEYFKKNGGLFTVASGRVPSSLKDRMEAFRELTNVPAILCNGGFCYDFASDTRFFEIEVDHQKAAGVIRFVKDNFDIYRIRASLLGEEIAIGDTFDEDSFKGWTRVSFDDRSCETLNNIRQVIEKRYKDDFSFMFACPEMFEFQDKAATKGQALDRLRKKLTCDGKANENLKIYAVGDYENDLDMLQNADVACCPENAMDTVKKAAKIHLCHCDDGAIADLIYRIESLEV